MAGAVSCALLSFLVSVAFILHRPDLSVSAVFLFGDESANLLVADALHRGLTLYRDEAYPYGPIPIHLYSMVASLFGNTPVTYLALLAVLAATSVGMCFVLIRRTANTSVAVGCVVVGLLPTMPLPGAIIGGYTASPYIPLERICLLAAVLLWHAPAGRSVSRSLVLGAVLGLCQGVRFGSGAVALAAVVLLDVAYSPREALRPLARAVARTTLPLLAGFLALQTLWTVWAFLTLPAPHAAEFLWPLQLYETHRTSGAPRWPPMPGWRMFLTQYALPLMGAALSVVSLWRSLRDRRAGIVDRNSAGAVHILLAFYGLASLAYFRHEHHFRQFAWMLIPAAAVIALRLQPLQRAALTVLCLPSLWPLASALLQSSDATVQQVAIPRGYTVNVPPDVAGRLNFLERSISTDRSPSAMIFVPNGSGWLYGYGIQHATRHAWFYSHAVVRPFEEDRFAQAMNDVSSIVLCTPSADLDTAPLPASARGKIREAFLMSSQGHGCRVWLRRDLVH